MKPIKFKEANKNLLKPQSMTDDECSGLWVYTDGEQCISCWKMSWKQRIMTLLLASLFRIRLILTARPSPKAVPSGISPLRSS